MKIALFGATGMIGSRVLTEAVSRGHEVTAVARDISKITDAGVKPVAGNILDVRSVASIVAGQEAVVSAFSPMGNQNNQSLLDATRALIAGMKQKDICRLIMVGGAGGLEIAPGKMLIDSPNFPAGWKGVAQAHIDALNILKTEAGDLEWTSFSPAAMIQPGTRTGKFRLGGDQLLSDDKGDSRISVEDYAIALVDELEKPKHLRQRFTIAY